MAEAADRIDPAFEFRLPPRPYPGLRPFEKHEWPIFFGRECMTDEVIRRLLRQRVLVIHGDSGCGKSSLVRAGVLPKLEQEAARGGASWKTYSVTPGDDPVGNLARAFAGAGDTQQDWQRELTFRRVLNYEGRDAVSRLAKLLLRNRDEHVCLLIDQFEELFVFAKRVGLAEAQIVTELLIGIIASKDETIHAILTMRSEFLGACALFPGFAEAANATQYLLPPMNHADLLRAIREPATLYGGEIERELAEQLICDVDGSQDQLPLIQHGLMLLHRMHVEEVGAVRSSWKLGRADYQAEQSLSAMLSVHADAVLTGAEARANAAGADAGLPEALFRAITDINSEGHALRRPQRLEQLANVTGASAAALGGVLDAFRAEGVSFVRPYGTVKIVDSDPIDISHEALLRCWKRIAEPRDGWLAHEFKDGLVWRSLLVQADSFDADPSNLLSPTTAGERAHWLSRRNPAWCLRYGGGWEQVTRLIAASLEAARRVERDRRKQLGLRIILTVVLLVAVFGLAFGTVAYRARARAERALADAEARRQEAERARDDAQKAEKSAKQSLEQSTQTKQELLSLIDKVRTNTETSPPATKATQAGTALRQRLGNIEGILNEYSTLERIAQVRLSLAPTSNRYNDRIVYNVRIWIEMPPERTGDVLRAEYFFNHPSFHSPLKTSTDAAHGFPLVYPGWGCVDATATLIARDNSRHAIPFDMCQLWSAAK